MIGTQRSFVPKSVESMTKTSRPEPWCDQSTFKIQNTSNEKQWLQQLQKLDMLRFQLISWTLIKFPESERERSFADFSLLPRSSRFKSPAVEEKRRQVSQVLGSIWLTFFTYAVFMFAAENYTLIRPLTTKMTMENPAIWRCISSHKWQVSIAMLGTSGV